MIDIETPGFLARKKGDPIPSCSKSKNPEIWFSDERTDAKSAAVRAKLVKRAKRICNGCPVLIPCREWALRQPNASSRIMVLHGIWGGLTRSERAKVLRGGKEVA